MAVCARFTSRFATTIVTNKWLLRPRTLNSILTVRTLKVTSPNLDEKFRDADRVSNMLQDSLIKILVEDRCKDVPLALNKGGKLEPADVEELLKWVDREKVESKKIWEILRQKEKQATETCKEAMEICDKLLRLVKEKEMTVKYTIPPKTVLVQNLKQMREKQKEKDEKDKTQTENGIPGLGIADVVAFRNDLNADIIELQKSIASRKKLMDRMDDDLEEIKIELLDLKRPTFKE